MSAGRIGSATGSNHSKEDFGLFCDYFYKAKDPHERLVPIDV
jgi:hypothetical protein